MTGEPSWRRPALYAGVSFLIVSVPVVLASLSYRETRLVEHTPETFGQFLALNAAQWYPWVFVVPFIDRRVRRARPAGGGRRLAALGGHAGLFALFAVGHWLVLGVTSLASTGVLGGAETARQVLPDAILYAVVTAAFAIAESRRRQTEVAERLRAQVAEARLDALRQQLNPHFLFNTLHHIVVQVRGRHIEPALKMLLALSDLLRQVLRERAQLIPLRDELHIVERYLEIERARFGDRLQVEVTYEPRTVDALVPSLLLQPLLENAMRHGVSAVDGTCRVWLTARAHEDRLVLEVRDAGPGIAPTTTQAAAGIGLANTAERLQYLYGGGHQLRLTPIERGGLAVLVDLPFQR